MLTPEQLQRNVALGFGVDTHGPPDGLDLDEAAAADCAEADDALGPPRHPRIPVEILMTVDEDEPFPLEDDGDA
jgi:hypothetical protein